MKVFRLDPQYAEVAALSTEDAIAALAAQLKPEHMLLVGYVHPDDPEMHEIELQTESLQRSPYGRRIHCKNKLRAYGPLPSGYRLDIICSMDIGYYHPHQKEDETEDQLDMEDFQTIAHLPIHKLTPVEPMLFLAVPKDSEFTGDGWRGSPGQVCHHQSKCPRTSLRIAGRLAKESPKDGLIWWNQAWMPKAEALRMIEEALEEQRRRRQQ